MPFDPKAYLTEPDQQAAGFDPHAYLSDTSHPADAAPAESSVPGPFEEHLASLKPEYAAKITPGIRDQFKGIDKQLFTPEGQFQMAAGSAGFGIPGALTSTLARRMGTNAAIGGTLAAAKTPQPGESRTGNALWAAGTSAVVTPTLEGLMKIPGAIKQGLTWTGGKLARISGEAAQRYANNPEMADELYGLNKHNPEALNQRVREQAGPALKTAYRNESEPLLQRLRERAGAAEVAVDPTQYQGTAAEPLIKGAWAKRGETTEVPVSYPVSASPFKTETTLGPASTQDLPYGADQRPFYRDQMAPTPKVEVSEVRRKVVPTEPQVVDYAPAPTQEMPAPMPDRVPMNGNQVLAAKRAAQEAADFNYNQNPEVYRAANDKEAIAGSNLRQTLEDSAPGTGTIE
jgi:hypothetical protein